MILQIKTKNPNFFNLKQNFTSSDSDSRVVSGGLRRWQKIWVAPLWWWEKIWVMPFSLSLSLYFSFIPGKEISRQLDEEIWQEVRDIFSFWIAKCSFWFLNLSLLLHSLFSASLFLYLSFLWVSLSPFSCSNLSYFFLS